MLSLVGVAGELNTVIIQQQQQQLKNAIYTPTIGGWWSLRVQNKNWKLE
jgi:hypothetical protein